MIGWRGGLVIVGVTGIVLGFAGLFAPFHVQKGSDQMQTEPLDDRTARRLFLIFALALAFGGILFRSFTLILPTFLEYRLGDISEQVRLWVSENIVPIEGSTAFNTLTANIVATFVYVVGIVGQYVGGHVADRYSLKHGYFFFFLIAMPFLLAIILFKSWVIIPASGLFVLFLLGMQPIENSLVAYLTPAKWRSMGFGLKFTFVFGAGAFGVKLVSLVEKSAGLEAVMQLNLVYNLGIVLMGGILILASRKVIIRHNT